MSQHNTREWVYLVLALTLIGLAVLLFARRAPTPTPEPTPTPVVERERVLEWPVFETSADAIQAAQEQAIATATQQLERILAQEPGELSFASTVVAVDTLVHEYAQYWNRLDLLEAVSPDPEVREAAGEAAVTLAQWYQEHIALNQGIYAQLQAFASTDEAARLRGQDRLLLDDNLAYYRRQGLTLDSEGQARITQWRARLTELTSQINLNITNDPGIVAFTRDELVGLSDEQVRQFEYDESTGRYLVQTALHSQHALVMENAERRATRRRALETSLRRAMDENVELIAEVVRLRARIAELLGYPTWADYRIEPRMAGTAEVARNFIVELSRRLDDTFHAEQLELRDIARAKLDAPGFEVSDLGLEDIPYYMSSLLEQQHAIDDEVVRQYFAEQDVLPRVLTVLGELFGLELVLTVPEQTWAEDLQVVMVSDAGSGRLLGAIYLDLHPRPGKFTHFAAFEIIAGRQLSAQRYQAPICAIVGNYPTPAGDQPALWSLSNVSTLLHEFGHALHCVVTEANYYAHSGFGVPLDFVEVPSQALERWLEDPAVLRRLTVHHQTREPMPAELIESLTSATNVGIGHFYKRQIAYGLIDFGIHTYPGPERVPAFGEVIYAMTNAIFGAQYYAVPDNTATLASFLHLWSGYDAGYYSYAWSDAIAAEFARPFRESARGFMDPELGARLREEVLQVGGSRPVDESIRAFLGREWNLDAFFAELLGDRKHLHGRSPASGIWRATEVQ